MAASLARFEAPRAVAVCERVARHDNGKPDYAWARAETAGARDTTGAGPAQEAVAAPGASPGPAPAPGAGAGVSGA